LTCAIRLGKRRTYLILLDMPSNSPNPSSSHRGPDQTTLTISLTKSLKQKIRKHAEADDRTVSNWVGITLAAKIAEEEKKA